jgi:hypothetical protein
MAIQVMKIKMVVKFHFVSNINVSSSFVSNFDFFSYVSVICCRCLVDDGSRVLNLQKLSIWALSQTCSSLGSEHVWSVFEKIHTKKRNRLKFFKINFKFIINYNFMPHHPLSYVL